VLVDAANNEEQVTRQIADGQSNERARLAPCRTDRRVAETSPAQSAAAKNAGTALAMSTAPS
jgi:hypothetical protein